MSISDVRDKVVNSIKKMGNSGFLHIIVSSSLVKVVSFISAIFLPRLLSKSDYGILTYVDNIRNYIIMINGLGIANATIRYCTQEKDDEKKRGIFYSTVLVGIIIDVVLCVLSAIIFSVVAFQFEGSNEILVGMAFLPIFVFLNEDIQFYMRAVFANREYSLQAFVYSGLMVLLQVLFTWRYGLNGVVVGRYLATILSLIIGGFLLKRIGALAHFVWPAWKEIVGYIKFGFVMMLTNMSSFMMQLNETFIQGIILKDEIALADYKVASFILTVSIFLSQAVALFLLPHFVKHAKDKQWIWSTFKKVFIINGAAMVVMHIVLIILSKYIVLILYGESYLNAVPIMRMLLVASIGQTVFRMLPGNILGGIGEEKFNLRINVIFLFVHLVVDVVAISLFGIYGAAVGLVIVYYISGLLMIHKLRKVCRENRA